MTPRLLCRMQAALTPDDIVPPPVWRCQIVQTFWCTPYAQRVLLLCTLTGTRIAYQIYGQRPLPLKFQGALCSKWPFGCTNPCRYSCTAFCCRLRLQQQRVAPESKVNEGVTMVRHVPALGLGSQGSWQALVVTFSNTHSQPHRLQQRFSVENRLSKVVAAACAKYRASGAAIRRDDSNR